MLFSRSADPNAAEMTAVVASDGRRVAVHADRWWAAVAVAGVAAVTAGGFIAQTGTFFRGGDWVGLVAFHNGPSWDPVDGTLALTSGVVFGALAPIAEWTFWPYRLVAVAALALALVAVYRLASRVAGPAIGCLATVLLASFSHATPILAQPFTMRFPLSIAMIVALAHVLDRSASSGGPPASRRAWATGTDLVPVVLLAAALTTSLAGFAATPIAAAALVAQRASWPRWVLYLTPVALWLAWFAWRGSVTTEPWNWSSRGQYLANLLGRSFQHLACNSATLGAVAAAGVVAVLWTDPERRFDASWRPLRWLAAAGVFAVATTYRDGSVWLRPLGGHPPDTHSWVIAVFVVLAVVESVRHRHELLSEGWRHAGLIAVGVAITLSSVTLVHEAETYRETAPDNDGLDVGTLSAVESLDELPDDSWAISIDQGEISARDYHDVVAHLGSPLEYIGVTPDESQEALRARDEIVVAGLGITAEPGDCQWTSAPTSLLEVDGPGRVVLASLDQNLATSVFVARLATPSINAEPFAEVEPGRTAIITLPDPGVGRVWSLWVEGFGLLGTCLA